MTAIIQGFLLMDSGVGGRRLAKKQKILLQ